MNIAQRTLVAAGVGLALFLPTLAQAQQIVPIWRFQMLDGGAGSSVINTGGPVINLGSFTDGSLPSGMMLDIWGRVFNDLDTGGNPPTIDNNLSISTFGVGSSAVPPDGDGQPFFAANGGGFPSFLLDQVAPQDFEDIFLGTFDESAFLASLPVDGIAHSVTLDFEVGANTVDANGSDTGNPFDPNYPTLIPGAPSFTITGLVNPSQVGGVPEPGTVALLAALGLSGVGLLRRRRA